MVWSCVYYSVKIGEYISIGKFNSTFFSNWRRHYPRWRRCGLAPEFNIKSNIFANKTGMTTDNKVLYVKLDNYWIIFNCLICNSIVRSWLGIDFITMHAGMTGHSNTVSAQVKEPDEGMWDTCLHSMIPYWH